MSIATETGRWYPAPPPGLSDETDGDYTRRLTSRTNHPYDHNRGRECSLGFHRTCSSLHGECTCECPCHSEPDVVEGPQIAWQAVEQLATLYFLPEATAQRVLSAAVEANTDSMAALKDRLAEVYQSPITPWFAEDVALILADLGGGPTFRNDLPSTSSAAATEDR